MVAGATTSSEAIPAANCLGGRINEWRRKSPHTHANSSDKLCLMSINSSQSWLSQLASVFRVRPHLLVGVAPVVASDSNSRFYSIQYVRGFAALLVVLYHQAIYLELMRGEPWLHDIVQGRPGLYGVVAFFVLSGFLMAEIAPKYGAATFLVHRVIRIYPAYLGCVALAYVFFTGLWLLLRPDASYLPAIGQMLSGHGLISPDILRLTLAPIPFPDYPLGIEWTLLYETTFYVLVTAAIALSLGRFLPHLAVVWLLVLAGTAWVAPQLEIQYTKPNLLLLGFFGINAGFIFGIIGSRAVRHIPPLFALMLGIVMLVVADRIPSRWAMLEACFGVAAIVLAVIARERRARLPSCMLLRKCGDWSFAMYLVHVPLIVGVYRLLPGQSAGVLLLASLAVILLASAAVGELELAVYRRLKRRVDAAPETARGLLAAAFLAMFFGASLVGLSLVT